MSKIPPTRDASTKSLWQSNPQSSPATTELIETEIYDAMIIGGGITGITIGLLLQQAGKRCLILEAEQIGFGTTGGTSAHLNTFFDATYPEVESDFSTDSAWLLAKAGKEALNMIHTFCNEHEIDCDLETKKAYLFAQNTQESKELKKILESTQKAGIAAFETTENGLPIPFDQAIQFENQGQFHPLKYIRALADAYINLGGQIKENSRMEHSSFEHGLHTISLSNQEIKGKNLIYATHIPPGINLFSFRCAPYRSYVLAVKLKNNSYPENLSYDMQEPYHYFRSHEIEGEKYLLIGGEDHKTGHGDPEQALQNLENYARRYFDLEEVSYKWSSQYYVPVDGLPYIGEMPAAAHTYVATGFNGNGMIFGTLSAKIISDQVQGIENSYTALFNPSRLKPIAGFTDFIKENADVAFHFIADRFGAEELESLNDLKAEDGKIVDFKGEKLAVCRDALGKVHALSPYCTHAGCVLQFNPLEKSWDCPCHGGRFSLDGTVLNGPPKENLARKVVGNGG